MCYVALDMGGGIKSCDVCDPYVIVLLGEGMVAFLELRENKDRVSLNLAWPNLRKVLV